jgi:hypothetical protein
MTDQRPRNLVVAPDLDNPGYLWRVEWFDSDGAGYITIFAGQEAEARAKDYHNAIKDGRLSAGVSFGSQRACFGFRATIAMGDF